jgi:uncharacterized protein YcaQ
MSVLQLSLKEARHLHLAAQGLLKKPRRRARPKDILSTIQQMSLLQIDTINVVARSPYLVLFSRLGSYPQHWLDESLRSGELMEYWAHEACFLPRSDFALVRHRMLTPDNMGWKYHRAWMEEHAGSIAELLAHIGQNGPVRSADFEHPRKGASGWWEWKPHKRHLEGLFTAGEVMVVERRNFHRVYDLTQRVMPHWDDERDALSREAQRPSCCATAPAASASFAPVAGGLLSFAPAGATGSAGGLAGRGLVVPVNVEALGEMWLHRDALAQLESAPGGKLPPAIAPCSRLSTRWSGIGNALSNCSTSAIAWSAIPRRRSVSMATSYCRCCTRENWSGGWTVKCIAKAGSWRSSPCGWRRGEDHPWSGAGLRRAINDFARWQSAERILCRRLPEGLFVGQEQGWEIDAD